MELTALTELFSSIGAPLALCVVLIFVIYQMGKRMNDQADANMARVQERCKEREDRLMEELRENRTINAQAIETIASYVNKLDNIQSDLKEIKTDVALIMVNGGVCNEHHNG